MEAMAPLGEQEIYNMNGLMPLNGLGLLHMNGQLPQLVKQSELKVVNGSGGATAVTGSGGIATSSQAAVNGTETAPSTTQAGQGAPNPSSGRSTPNGNDPSAAKLFVGGLSWQTSTEKLRQYFSMFGTVTDVLIMKDPITQVSLPSLFPSFILHPRVVYNCPS
jgi:hypothetical protein